MTTGTLGMASAPQRVIEDYTLLNNEGKPVRLSDLFGGRGHLVILHNMGKGCPNCALWGDEFNGMLKQIETAAAFCLIGPDDPKTQKSYVRKRRWKAKLYSAQGSTFIKDMGFEDEEGGAEPGISILERGKDGKLQLIWQVNVTRDERAPSVLETLWEIPTAKMAELAFGAKD